MLYIKNTRKKINTCYKSLYLKEELAKKIEKISAADAGVAEEAKA